MWLCSWLQQPLLVLDSQVLGAIVFKTGWLQGEAGCIVDMRRLFLQYKRSFCVSASTDSVCPFAMVLTNFKAVWTTLFTKKKKKKKKKILEWLVTFPKWPPFLMTKPVSHSETFAAQLWWRVTAFGSRVLRICSVHLLSSLFFQKWSSDENLDAMENFASLLAEAEDKKENGSTTKGLKWLHIFEISRL